MITTSSKIIAGLALLVLLLLGVSINLYSSLSVEKHKVLAAEEKYALMSNSFKLAIDGQNASIEKSAEQLQIIGNNITKSLAENRAEWAKLDSSTAKEVKRLSGVIPKFAPCEERVAIFGEELLKLKH